MTDRHVTFNNFETASRNIARRPSAAASARYDENSAFPEGSSVIAKSTSQRQLGPAEAAAAAIQRFNAHVRIQTDGKDTKEL